MTAAVTQAHLAPSGRKQIHSSTVFVTLLDTESDGGCSCSPPADLALARRCPSARRDRFGWQIAQMFSWLRPNDLVWNYWVNNYPLGQTSGLRHPRLNADTTRLFTAFHHQPLDMVAGNQMVHPGAAKVLGTLIDLSRITTDTYVAAGSLTTPPATCYQTTQVVSGHPVQPAEGSHPDRRSRPEAQGSGTSSTRTPPSAEQWLADAQRHEGLVGALGAVAGRLPVSKSRHPSPTGPRFPAIEPPGTYIYK
jgi:polyhydroxyalkanoate synthase